MLHRRSLSFDASALEASHHKPPTKHHSKATKRGRAYKEYSNDDLQTALINFRKASRSSHPLSAEDAARPLHIPPSTLRRYNKLVDQAIASSPRGADISHVMETVIATTHSGTPRTLLDHDTEAQLINWAKTMCEMTIPVDLDMFRLKAKRLQFASHNIPITDENRLDIASRHWWKNLRKRHPELVLRVPQKMEWLRCRATQPEIINHFYSLLKYYLDKYAYTPEQIFAADEVGVDGDNKTKRVIATRGTNTHANTRKHTRTTPYERIFFAHRHPIFCLRTTQRVCEIKWLSPTHVYHAYMQCCW